jgi:hypothetical protein
VIGQEGIRASPDQAVTSSEPEGTESVSTKSRQNRQSTTPQSLLSASETNSMPASGRSLQRLSNRILAGSRGRQEVVCRHMPAIDHPVSWFSVSESKFDACFGPKPSADTEPNPSPDHLDAR